MIYAFVDGVKRAPLAKGEKAICPDCGNILTSVIPVENIKHWRHKGGDCDTWSEPEGEWHLKWKEYFDLDCREICLVDTETGERHRADILCNANTTNATVLELQHSNISEEERISREQFYKQKNKMFWLVHIHSETSFNEFSFGASLDFNSSPFTYQHRTFYKMRWCGRSNQFIEKWKRATAHVFFDFKGYIFYLAGENICRTSGMAFGRGDFALCTLTPQEFLNAVKAIK